MTGPPSIGGTSQPWYGDIDDGGDLCEIHGDSSVEGENTIEIAIGVEGLKRVC